MMAANNFCGLQQTDLLQGNGIHRAMRKIALVWLLAICPSALAQEANELPKGWEIFRPDDNSFEVAFPETPVVEAGTEEDHTKKTHKSVTIRVGKIREEISYAVTIIEDIRFETAAEREKEFIKRGDVVGPILLAGADSFVVGPLKFPGAQFGFQHSAHVDTEKKGLGPGILHIHQLNLMKDNRLYSLTFSNRVSVESLEKTAFLKSFRFLDNVPTKTAKKDSTPSTPKQEKLRRFRFVKESFSVLLPVEPKRAVEQFKSDSGEEVPQIQFTSNTPAGAFMVSLQDSTPEQSGNAPLIEQAYTRARDALISTFTGKLLEEKNVRINEAISGREFRISIPSASGEYRTRIFFANQKFIQLIAVGTPEFVISSQAAEFLASFELLNQKSVEPKLDLIDYASNFGGFRAQLPFKPVYSRRTLPDGTGAERVQHLYMCDPNDNSLPTVLVSVSESPTLGQQTAQELDETFRRFTSGMAGKKPLSQFERIDCKACENAWDFQYESADASFAIRGRILAAEDRFYVLQVAGNSQFLTSDSAQNMIDSLNITTGKNE